ncbi:hypothetical protein CEXT_812391 [Caerostris extrusa]|uniref:Uncharacterized protein n=1 Tax=Caerostris extrusa TaxID=172846 RepID=A0AAV4NCM3_CAEEX|nr:hypothetical protein CEXT_812391 [Caerostris extrusa]
MDSPLNDIEDFTSLKNVQDIFDDVNKLHEENVMEIESETQDPSFNCYWRDNKYVVHMDEIDKLSDSRIKGESGTSSLKNGNCECYNCQKYFHHSKYCTCDPRCLKYAGSHPTKQCTKALETSPVWALLSSNPAANFSGSPKNAANFVLAPPAKVSYNETRTAKDIPDLQSSESSSQSRFHPYYI